MKVYPILKFFSTTLFLLFSSSAASDTISPNQPIKDGNTIISNDQTYELGFFSPGNSNNRYLGIWYKHISVFTVVWVANRDTPINDTSGIFRVSKEGSLLILSGNNSVIWSSNSTKTLKNPVAQLLDTGNLVVWDQNDTKENQDPIWQSFDYPGDTLLPGQKLGKDLVTGKERNLTSWKSPDDPSVGRYRVFVNLNGYPQTFELEGGTPHSRFGPWNGEGFRGLPRENTNPIYSVEFVVNQKEIYYSYKLISPVLQRIILTWDGSHLQYSWINRTNEWVLYGNIVIDNCSRYGRCGPYGICSTKTYPPCNCMEGFEPRVLEEWNSGDWSSGCQRRKAFECGSSQEDGFQKVSVVKFPDTQHSWYNVSMSLRECEMACRRNCNCSAFANLDIRKGGSGCLLWFDGLMDIREYDDNQDLYVRMATSELAAGKSSFKRKKLIMVVVLSVLSVVLLVSAVAYAYRKKKKGGGFWTHNFDRDHISADQVENLEELPFFSLHKIAKATDNFHVDNKIGEGGFGPVYKGILKDGQVIAVKRLSETSQQGPDEFKNEVMCIAKLQHRNLVKLLGYCIHGSEKILVYEYMDNKSLDSFLFDETKSSMLNWAQRFQIIHGMARGILYLHQDSRLQIIHRDLKAANILLDHEMNPKISDFGLARKFEGQDAMAKTRNVVGTYGYISPEYAVHGHFSVKSDVFSFGVIVLEIVSGEKNRGFSHEGHSDNLLGHAWRLYKEGEPLELISTSLRNSCVVSQVLRSIHVGLLCVQHHAEDRPTMSSVVSMLTTEGPLPPPKQPAFFTEESYREFELVSSSNVDMITLLYAR